MVPYMLLMTMANKISDCGYPIDSNSWHEIFFAYQYAEQVSGIHDNSQSW